MAAPKWFREVWHGRENEKAGAGWQRRHMRCSGSFAGGMRGGQGQSSQPSSEQSSQLTEQPRYKAFEKFYETYDVKEGDGMYLAPEARVVLW